MIGAVMMQCPECGKTIAGGVMCADCADKISTDICYGLTLKSVAAAAKITGWALVIVGVLWLWL